MTTLDEVAAVVKSQPEQDVKIKANKTFARAVYNRYLYVMRLISSIRRSITKNTQLSESNLATQTIEKNKLEQVVLTDATTFEYMAEQNRIHGQSGVLNARQYEEAGTESYHRPFDIGYAAINMHDHPQYRSMSGLAESSYMVNGYYIRARHNDYRWKMPSISSKGYLETEDIKPPPVPDAVMDAGSTEEKINQMRIELNKGTNFYLNLAYVEVWFENISDDITEPFDSFRHAIDAENLTELLQKQLYLNITGHKNRRENIPYMNTLVRSVVDGQPIISKLMYRIAVAPIGNLNEYPIEECLSLHKDLKTLHRKGWDGEKLLRTRLARFNVNPKKGVTKGNFRNQRTILDEWMEKIPGLDNYAGDPIKESYSQYGLDDVVLDHKTTDEKDAKFFSRWYTIDQLDASNRKHAKRGFNDPTLFVSLNTQDKVTPITVGEETKRVSYAFPLELLIDTPLQSWNPFNIKELPRAEITGDGETAETAYEGFRFNSNFYRTPESLFSGNELNPDPADTTAGTKWVLDGEGNPQACVASGVRTHLSSILGETSIRLRYPIYPQYHDGSYQMAELESLKEVFDAYLNSRFNWPESVVDPVSHEVLLQETNGHVHQLFLRKSESEKLSNNITVEKESSLDNGHVHKVTLTSLTEITVEDTGHIHSVIINEL